MSNLELNQLLNRKVNGHFRITHTHDRAIIEVFRTGEPEEVILCVSPGHANQVRQSLSDEGLMGIIEDDPLPRSIWG